MKNSMNIYLGVILFFFLKTILSFVTKIIFFAVHTFNLNSQYISVFLIIAFALCTYLVFFRLKEKIVLSLWFLIFSIILNIAPIDLLYKSSIVEMSAMYINSKIIENVFNLLIPIFVFIKFNRNEANIFK